MQDQLFEALGCWARKPTWFTGHPSDESNFKLAVSNVKKLPFTPTKDEIYEAILEHQIDASTVMSTPKDIRPHAEKFAIKIAKKL